MLLFDTAESTAPRPAGTAQSKADSSNPAPGERDYHPQKMESLGGLAGGMAHDMNNVLAAIMAVASAMEAELSPGDRFYDDVQDILRACKRGSRLTRALLSFARRHRMVCTAVDINELLDEVVTIVRRTACPTAQVVFTPNPDPLVVEGDADQLNQVFMNLCLNAAAVVDKGGRIEVQVECRHRDAADLWRNPDARPGDYVCVRVRDTGPGIPPALRDKIFEPFFTTKPKGQGTGLGLAMAYGTVQKHGGQIYVADEPGPGACFAVELPRLAAHKVQSPQRPPAPDPVVDAAVERRVLLVDDEPLFRSSSKRILSKLGYQVVCADNGRRALEILAEGPGFDLIILDMIMPVMNGRDTFFALRAQWPHIPVLIASGFTEEAQLHDMLADRRTAFLPKPFDMASLSRKLGAWLPQLRSGAGRATASR